MNTNLVSLSDLRDLSLPHPVAPWPLAPGWWVLIGAASLLVLGFSVHACRQWRENAYRRAALAELSNIEDAAELSLLLKRTALATYPRSFIASLHGGTWCDWLEQTAGSPLPANLRELLDTRQYAAEPTPMEPGLLAYARIWIVEHRPGEKGPC